MKKTMKYLVLAAALTLAAEVRAHAQVTPEQKVFVNVNVGAQLSDRSIDTSASFPLYDETATAASTQAVSGGVLFDFSGGYRVWRDFFVAVGVSSFGDTEVANVTASIPDLLLFNQPKTVTATVPDLTRREIGVHTQLVWFAPVAEKVDIALFAGPSFIRLKQELVTTVTVAANTQNATPVVVSQSGSAVGVNLGVDGTYAFTPHVGAGLFLRYVTGSVDLPAFADAKVTGVQFGVGARLRF